MRSNVIYLTSETGAAVASNEQSAKILEIMGYLRCSQDDYRKKREWQDREDQRIADFDKCKISE
ncbi:MAG: hypothetical protein HY265_04680 [Deltaproteobacteria bacterium]|nr:hypothetical protein [Deltaproteobacteria bacterium]